MCCVREPGNRFGVVIMAKCATSTRVVCMPQVRLTLEGAPCIWAGAGFVAAADAALATPADFAPYLEAVPPELAQHKELLLALGVRLLAAVYIWYWIFQRLIELNIPGFNPPVIASSLPPCFPPSRQKTSFEGVRVKCQRVLACCFKAFCSLKGLSNGCAVVWHTALSAECLHIACVFVCPSP